MEKYFTAALTSVDQIGTRRMRMVLNHFGSAREAWSAPDDELINAGLSDKIVQTLSDLRRRHPNLPDEIVERCSARGVKLCGIDDDDYPVELRSIGDAPLLLYYKGELQPSAMRIAMVGTRHASRYGEKVASDIAEDLARMGITIVSGGAAGIDSISHRGALKGGRTVAVLGCGVEVVYPLENRRLFDRILESGAIISEYPPKASPKPGQFLQRNRIIAGLSRGTVIVEAGEKSGALDTAKHAIDYERTLFAVPGSIYAERSLGCNNLIKYNGAVLVRNAQDVLNAYGMQLTGGRRELEPLTEDEAKIFELVPTELAASTDELIFRAEELGLDELTVPYLINVLNALQLKGYVMEDAAGSYLRTTAAAPVVEQATLFETNQRSRPTVEKKNKSVGRKKNVPALDGDEAIVFDVIDDEPMAFDIILTKLDENVERTFEVTELNGILFALELKGLINQDDLGNYSRTR
ncbi:MAG: DNA-processing protein DprA [Selenomonadaceae bacterium]|nr:DNA-processing protein DprA [Selenomonadaceae bacterium]